MGQFIWSCLTSTLDVMAIHLTSSPAVDWVNSSRFVWCCQWDFIESRGKYQVKPDELTRYSVLYTPFCPVHWPWCRLSILYAMCTFEVDWSWVALLSKLMDTLTANIYEMRQVRSANYSTLDGWPLLLHLTRNYGRVNNLLSYLIGRFRL